MKLIPVCRTIIAIIVITPLSALIFPSSAQAVPPSYALMANTRHIPINRIEYLVESEPLSCWQAADDAHADQWLSFSGERLNLGNYHAPVWLRFEIISNLNNGGHKWIMVVGQQLLDHIEVYLFNQIAGSWSPRQVSGNLESQSVRSLIHRDNLFPISMSSGEPVTAYIRVASQQQLSITTDIWQERAFWLHDLHRILFLGGFFGILVVMSLYNGSLFIFTKDINYLIYVAYVLAITCYELASTGIGTTYLWPDFFWLKQVSYLLFASLSFLTGTIFIRYFLSLKTYGGWVLHLNNVFLVYWVLVSLVCLLPVSPYVHYSLETVALISPAAGMATSIYLWFKGNIQAKYYTIAYLCLNIGTIALMLGLMGLVKRGWATEYGQMVGFVFELTLLSIALADRINRERMAKETAQREALAWSEKVSKAREEKLMVQEQILDVQRKANEDLEFRVLERTNELERAMTNLELANKELSKLSFTDPLTKVYNRRYYEEILSNEIKRASRTEQPLSVAAVDIDHFKQINDTYGHLIGDECLRLVAKALKNQLGRTSDLIARIGGEEFAIILPSTTRDNAMIVADRARAAVESINFIHRGNRILLKVSIGVAGWIPERDETNDGLLNAADTALYKAKHSGRNKVLAAEI